MLRDYNDALNCQSHTPLDLFRKAKGKFIADVDEIRPQFQDSTVDSAAVFTSSVVRSFGPSVGSTIDALDDLTLTNVDSLQEEVAPWYADQILPFDVTMVGNNEYGASTSTKLFGLEILNEGSGISVDDPVTEAQATFVARAVERTWSLPPGTTNPPRARGKPAPRSPALEAPCWLSRPAAPETAPC